MKIFYLILIIICALSIPLSADNVDDMALKYFGLAQENNSQIQSANNNWQAEVERIGVVGKLPNPQLSFGYFLKNVETAVGPQEYKIGILQRLPWFGKLSTARKIQVLQAQNNQKMIQKALETLYLEIQTTLYNVYFVEQQKRINTENLALLKQWQNILEIKYQSTVKSYADVIKIQQEIFKLEEVNSSLDKQKEKLRIQLESLTESDIIPDELSPLEVSSEVAEFSGDSIRKNLHQSNTDLQMIAIQKNIAELMQFRAKQDYIPNAGVGLDYIITGDKYAATGAKVKDSGKDPLVLMFSLELPLQFGKIKKNIKASEYRVSSVQQMQQEKQKNILAKFDQLSLDLEDLKSNFEVYDKKIIPTTKQSLELRTNELKTGKSDIYKLIENQRDLLKYQLKRVKILTDIHITQAKIATLSGVNTNE